jgi:hypothetical protein
VPLDAHDPNVFGGIELERAGRDHHCHVERLVEHRVEFAEAGERADERADERVVAVRAVPANRVGQRHVAGREDRRVVKQAGERDGDSHELRSGPRPDQDQA